jgi:tRNA U55 pseudouridine synthase TruB
MHLLYKKQGETCLECLHRFRQAENGPQNGSEDGNRKGPQQGSTGLKNGPETEAKAPVISMTYAGRLDPLAAGLLIVLEGDEIREKEAYLKLPKTYEFEVVFGIATDTFDQLGVIVGGSATGFDAAFGDKDSSKEFLSWPTLSFDQDFGAADIKAADGDVAVQDANFKKLIGKVKQAYPFYSSKPIDGVPLFQYVKDHGIAATIPKLPTNEVEIYDIEVMGEVVDEAIENGMEAGESMICQTITLRDSLTYHVNRHDLASESIAFAERIKGDFRQDEIIESWKRFAMNAQPESNSDQKDLKIMKFRMTVSSGFYIRSFACWLGQMIGSGAIARNIVRVKVGNLAISDLI